VHDEKGNTKWTEIVPSILGGTDTCDYHLTIGGPKKVSHCRESSLNRIEKLVVAYFFWATLYVCEIVARTATLFVTEASVDWL